MVSRHHCRPSTRPKKKKRNLPLPGRKGGERGERAFSFQCPKRKRIEKINWPTIVTDGGKGPRSQGRRKMGFGAGKRYGQRGKGRIVSFLFTKRRVGGWV